MSLSGLATGLLVTSTAYVPWMAPIRISLLDMQAAMEVVNAATACRTTFVMEVRALSSGAMDAVPAFRVCPSLFSMARGWWRIRDSNP